MKTLFEAISSDKDVLTPSDVAPIIGVDPQDLRDTARTHPERLGFPVMIIGSRVKIPRAGFIRFMEGK